MMPRVTGDSAQESAMPRAPILNTLRAAASAIFRETVTFGLPSRNVEGAAARAPQDVEPGIHQEWTDDVLILKLHGRMDNQYKDTIARIRDCVPSDVTRVVVDTSAVTQTGDVLAGLLLYLTAQLDRRGGKLLFGPLSKPAAWFGPALCRMGKVYASTSDAVRSFRDACIVPVSAESVKLSASAPPKGGIAPSAVHRCGTRTCSRIHRKDPPANRITQVLFRSRSTAPNYPDAGADRNSNRNVRR